MKRARDLFPEHASAGRVPARSTVGNIVWTERGSVWGIWKVTPTSTKYLSHAEQLAFHEKVRQALLSLPPESLAFSVCPPTNRVDAGVALLSGVEASETWRIEAEESLDALAAWDPWERWFYVAGHLGAPSGGWWGETREQATALFRRVLPRPTERDIAAATARAKKVESALRRTLEVKRPGANEVRWIYARRLRLGIRDLEVQTELTPGRTTEVAAPGYASIRGVVLVEGDEKKKIRNLAPGNGVLRVEEPQRRQRKGTPGTERSVGYQCHLVLADMPAEYDYPTAEAKILFALEAFSFPVEWAIKMRRSTNAESKREAAAKAKSLVTQLGEEGQGKEIERTGSIPPDLVGAFDALAVRQDRLGIKSNANVKATITFTVWGPDRETAESRADAVETALAPNEWGIPRPNGGQAGLLEMGMPGGRESPVIWEYAQALLPGDIAGLGLFEGSDLGDESGMLFAARMDCMTPRPVFWNPESPLDAEGSASVMFCGTLGQGKSLAAKEGLAGVIARGGRGAVVDRTVDGEWIRAAAAMSCSVSVITTDAENHGSFDFFRIKADPEVFNPKATALGFCLLVTQSRVNTLQGICVADAVEEVGNLPAEERSMAAVLETLRRYYEEENRKGAEEAFLTLRSFARGRYGRLVFDASVPPADLTADLVVFHVPDLELPDRETLRSADLAAAILPEQLGALGVFYVIAAAGRAIILAEPERFAVFVGDEAWAWMASPQAAALLETTARDGRKRRAGIWLLSQHPDDVSDPRLLALIPVRFVFGQGDGAGEAAAIFLGAEPTEALISKLTKTGPEGGIVRRDDPEALPEPARCFMRDKGGRIGEIVIRPPSPRHAEAFETNVRRRAAYAAARRRAEQEAAVREKERLADVARGNGNGSGTPTVLVDAEVGL